MGVQKDPHPIPNLSEPARNRVKVNNFPALTDHVVLQPSKSSEMSFEASAEPEVSMETNQDVADNNSNSGLASSEESDDDDDGDDVPEARDTRDDNAAAAKFTSDGEPIAEDGSPIAPEDGSTDQSGRRRRRKKGKRGGCDVRGRRKKRPAQPEDEENEEEETTTTDGEDESVAEALR